MPDPCPTCGGLGDVPAPTSLNPVKPCPTCGSDDPARSNPPHQRERVIGGVRLTPEPAPEHPIGSLHSDKAEIRRLRAERDEANAYAKEGWDWLTEALDALGAKDVFGIKPAKARADSLQAQLDEAVAEVRQQHHRSASIAGSPCVCKWCRKQGHPEGHSEAHNPQGAPMPDKAEIRRLREGRESLRTLVRTTRDKLYNQQARADSLQAQLDEAVEALEVICEIGETRDVAVARQALASIRKQMSDKLHPAVLPGGSLSPEEITRKLAAGKSIVETQPGERVTPPSTLTDLRDTLRERENATFDNHPARRAFREAADLLDEALGESE